MELYERVASPDREAVSERTVLFSQSTPGSGASDLFFLPGEPESLHSIILFTDSANCKAGSKRHHQQKKHRDHGYERSYKIFQHFEASFAVFGGRGGVDESYPIASSQRNSEFDRALLLSVATRQ